MGTSHFAYRIVGRVGAGSGEGTETHAKIAVHPRRLWILGRAVRQGVETMAAGEAPTRHVNRIRFRRGRKSGAEQRNGFQSC